MADRNTVIYGNQIKDATITEDELNASVAGDGLSGGAGSPLALDLNELTGAVVDVTADSIAIVDADDNSTKKESLATFVDAIAGSGLTYNAGVLDVDAITDNVTEADFSKDDFSATLNGALTEFDLTDVPVTASLQVFINGVLGEEGVGNDYQLNAGSGETKTIKILGDILATDEKLIVYYIKDN